MSDEVAELHRELERLRSTLAQKRQAESRYEWLFQATPVACIVLDSSGGMLEANRAAQTILELPKPLDRKPFPQLIVREDILAFLKHLRECRLKRRSVEMTVRVLRKSGSEITLRLRITPLPPHSPYDRPDAFYVQINDDAEFHRRDLEHEAREKEYRDLFDAIEGIVWEADADTLRRTRVSQQAERLLGYPVERWLSDPMFWIERIFVDDRENVLNITARHIAVRQDYVCEYRMIASDRRTVWLRESVKIIEVGSHIKMRGIAVDITEQKRIHSELEKSQTGLEERIRERTAELEQTVGELESFSYTLSHDMRAPLRTMHGFCELLVEKWGPQLGPQGSDFLNRVQESAHRLDALVQDVLKYSRLGQAQVELVSVDPEKLLRSIIGEYPSLQEPNAEIKINGPFWPILAHEGFLTQCISNILSNAVKFVPPNTKPCIRIHAAEMGERVQIWFEDNGIGIAPKDQLRIFRVFQRVHAANDYEGTGVGLAIVQRAAERMGGRVGVESAPGQGSRFWFQFHRA